MFVHRVHRLAGTLRIAGPANHRPALRQGIDLTFRIRPGAERFPIIEVGAPVPLAVPGVLFDVFLQLLRLGEAAFGEGVVVSRPRQFRELREHVVKKECQPDTFAAPIIPHLVHAVVPIARTDQGQAVLAEFQTVLDGAHAMFIKRGRFLRAVRQIVIRFLLRHDRPGFEKGNLFVEHTGVRDTGDVTAGDVRQPEIVVGNMCADAAARRRMPPVLHVAFAELMRGGTKQMFPGESWLSMHQRHHILQLIAEPVGSAGLIKSRSSPEPGAQGLIQEPAVRHHIHGGIGRIHVDRTERSIPEFMNTGERGPAGLRPAKALD